MSERWGPCRSCQGKGWRLMQTFEPVDDGEDPREVYGADGEFYYKMECWLCGGTGQSGDTLDYRG